METAAFRGAGLPVPTGDGPTVWFDARLSGEHFVYEDLSGQQHDLLPLSTVVPGWRPVGLFLVPGKVSLIEFERNSDQATWFVDDARQRLGGSVLELSDPQRASLIRTFRPTVDRLYENVFSENPGFSDSADFFRINAATRIEIARVCFAGEGVSIWNVVTERCDFDHMADTLRSDFQEAIIAGAPANTIQLVDPTDASTCLARHGIALDDMRAIYRLKTVDARDLWVCVGDHYANIVGVYDPAGNIIYVASDHHALKARHAFRCLDAEFRQIAATFGDVLPDYLNSSDTRIASFLRPPPSNHLGHQLWNELSGIQFAVGRLGRSDLPTFLIPAADGGTEAFGPVEEIFPELYRSVVRWPSSLDFRRQALMDRFTLVRLSQIRVTSELRARLNVRVGCLPELSPDRDRLAELARQDRRIFVLGLRVENRTIADLDSFVRTFVRMCAETVPGSVVVIDGHNSQRREGGGASILASHGQWGARRQPVAVERELAASALAAAHERDVEIVDLIGEPVDRSLCWICHADCFVTIWGAGLAKYRWVANRPGFVITSAWNRRHRPDLHIYSSPEFMDAPEDMRFIDAHEVRDRPDAVQLVSFQSDQMPDSYYNFELKDAEIACVRDYIMQVNDRGRREA